jgi:hypothetical protein
VPLTCTSRGGSSNRTSGPRFQAPLSRITSVVSVQTTSVSMNGSRPATTPSRTGSSVFAAEWAMGADPWPASFEKSARFMPQRNAKPAVPPKKAPWASVGEKAETTISRSMSGTSPRRSSTT